MACIILLNINERSNDYKTLNTFLIRCLYYDILWNNEPQPPLGTQRRRAEEQIMKILTSHIKLQSHTQRITVTEESPWDCHYENNLGTNEFSGWVFALVKLVWPHSVVFLLTFPWRFFCCNISLCFCGMFVICGVCFVPICSISLFLLVLRRAVLHDWGIFYHLR